MAISANIGIGAAIVIVGLAGLVYSMPLASNAAANKSGPVFQEADVPKYPTNFMQYVALEIISAAVLTGGIAMLSLGLSDTLKEKNQTTQLDTKRTNVDTHA